MNQYKKAYNTLKSLTLCGTCTTGNCGKCEGYNVKSLALEALEKQIPMKPLEKHYEELGELPYIKTVCPTGCRVQVSSYDNYCNKCGQKLDWSKK